MKKLTEITIGGQEPSLRASGRIEVKVLDYDTYFDLPLLDEDVKAETKKRLNEMFKPQTQN